MSNMPSWRSMRTDLRRPFFDSKSCWGIAGVILGRKSEKKRGDSFSFLGCMAAAGVFFCVLRESGLNKEY